MNLSAILTQLIAVAKADAGKLVLPALVTFLQGIASNPNALNLTVGLAKLNVDLLAALPTIGQDELKALSTLLATEAQTLLAPGA